MSKRAYIFCFIVFILGFIVAYLAGVELGTYRYNTNQDKQVNVNPEKETEALTEGYWVKANNNKIYVYKSDGETIVAETDIDISEFSNQEKKILENGIYLESAEKLFKYLEANTS
ncbi:MAG: hypothetical protein ACLRZ9_06470 [Eubacterium sp.]